MKYGSVCSGIEAATVAWHPLGWRPAFFSEIEAFPSAVLEHHYPEVENRGDMTKFKRWPNEAIDVLVGGTPCQSFSVSGFRRGLDDPRGNLALVFLAIADRLRPEWVVWENVPGVLSSKEGRDFASFLGGLGKLGYGFAYRVLDARYFGVPQRRRRPFVVGHLGDWRRAAAVLLERGSLQGNPAPCRKAGERVAPSLDARSGTNGQHTFNTSGGLVETSPTIPSRQTGGGGLGTDFDLDGGLIEDTPPLSRCLNAGGMGRQDWETETLIPIGGDFDVAHTLKGDGFDASEDGTGQGIPLVAETLRHHPRAGSNCLGAIAFGAQNSPSSDSLCHSTEVTPTLDKSKIPAICFSSKDHGVDAGEIATTLRGMGHDGSHPNGGGQVAVNQAGGVRRLTPRECERLQGFPDDYTLVPYRKKPAADGPRYKAIGNSMAVPVMRWIGERIMKVTSADRG